MPPAAVTTVVMVLAPSDKGILADAVPDATAVPFTVMVAEGSDDVGVSVIEVVEAGTVAV